MISTVSPRHVGGVGLPFTARILRDADGAVGTSRLSCDALVPNVGVQV